MMEQKRIKSGMHSAFLVTIICVSEVLTMIGVFTLPALFPVFIREWQLSNAEAGWLAGIFFAGYAISVPVIVALTDRIDARYIYLAGSSLAAISLMIFVFFANGFWTALVLRLLGGIGLAGTYMPGLRMLVDRFEGEKESRAVAFYTASFSLGTAFSFYISGKIGMLYGWEIAHLVAAFGSFVAIFLIILTLSHVKPDSPVEKTSLLDFRPVLRNRPAMGYILAYGAHSWELFAYRSWVVTFLFFSLSLQGDLINWPSPATIATLGALVAVITSILGNEIADKFGRRRTISLFLLLGGGFSLFAGFVPALPYWLVTLLMLLYAALIQLDSAALTAGAIQSADEGRRGTTLGLHASIGFGGGAIGPLAVGLTLDLSGGIESGLGWGLGFVAMGLITFLGSFALWNFRDK